MSNLTSGSPTAIGIRVGIALVVLAGVLAFSWKQTAGRPPELFAMCPPDPGSSRLTLITGKITSYKSKTSVSPSFDVYDLTKGGAKVASRPFSSMERPICFGGNADNVWVYAKGGDDLHLRRRDSGTVVASFADLVARAPGLSQGIHQLGVDRATGSATVQTKEARSISLSPGGGQASPSSATPTMFQLYGGFSDGYLATDAIPFHTSGNPRLLLKGNRRISFEGHPRARVLIDGKPLGGSVDFYLPAFLPNPADGTVEWPDGTLMIAEETLIGSRTYQVTRISLSGAVHFTYKPDVAVPPRWTYRPIPWQAMAGGKMLVHLGGEGVIAIDALTGKELFRAKW